MKSLLFLLATCGLIFGADPLASETNRVRLGNVTVTLSPPVLVALGAPGEQRWGHHQFPALSRLPDGRLWLTYNASDDRGDAYGHPGPAFVSTDQGRTWAKAQPEDPLLAVSHSVVSSVRDGEFICVPMSPGLGIVRERLQLPEPVARFNAYGEVLQFQLADCPPRVREFIGRIPALRWLPKERAWRRETTEWDTTDALVSSPKNDFVFSRPYLDNAVARLGDRLFYASYHLGHRLPDGSVPKNYSAWCMVSDDNGHQWRRHGLIAHDPTGNTMVGEPSLVVTGAGELTCLIRTTDHRQLPLLMTHSRDGGLTWEPTRELFPFGVMPQTLRLGNGVVAASFGRPGVQLAFAQDAAARTWSAMLPLIAGAASNVSAHSCGYTRMVPLDERSLLVAHSDFKWPDEQGRPRKAIVVRRVTADREPAGSAAAPRTRRVLYNFDGDSCLTTKANSKGPVAVNVDDVKRLLEEIAYDGSRVDTVLVCINAQVMYYPTQVGTMRGTLSTPEERAKWPASEKQRFENLKTFFAEGVDPYAIMLAEAKRRGCEALLTFRMNDDHGDDFLRTQFQVDHPEWRLGTQRYRGKDALDFGRDEVRDHIFRLLEEAVRRYDSDGLELDFNRFPTFFKDGTTDERVAKMNALVERVRAMLDTVGRERGRRLILSVRPPSNYGRTPPTPATARQLGCDVPAWVQRGWVDFVAVSEFLHERGDLPVAQWKQAIPSVPIYGGIECTKTGAQKNLSADEYRHAATQLLKSGADGIYLFNFFTSREGGANAYEPPFAVLRDLGTAGTPVRTSP